MKVVYQGKRIAVVVDYVREKVVTLKYLWFFLQHGNSKDAIPYYPNGIGLYNTNEGKRVNKYYDERMYLSDMRCKVFGKN